MLWEPFGYQFLTIDAPWRLWCNPVMGEQENTPDFSDPHWKGGWGIAFLAFLAGFGLAWYFIVPSKDATIERLREQITVLKAREVTYTYVTNEDFSLSETNNVLCVLTNDYMRLAVRLSRPPIRGSLEIYVSDSTANPRELGGGGALMHNLVFLGLSGYDSNTLRISCRYVIDTNNTYYYKRMPQLGTEMRLVSADMWSTKPPEDVK